MPAGGAQQQKDDLQKDVHAGGAQSQQEGCCSAQSYIVCTKQQNNDDADDDEGDDVQPTSQKIVFSDSNFCDYQNDCRPSIYQHFETFNQLFCQYTPKPERKSTADVGKPATHTSCSR